MSPHVSTATNTTHHSEHLGDRAAMLAMRTMIALQPKADLGPAGRAAFDELMEKTPSAEGVTYEAATVGGVPGWWCRPAAADVGPAILYLHGGAYVLGSTQSENRTAAALSRPERPLRLSWEQPTTICMRRSGSIPASPAGPPLTCPLHLPPCGKVARRWSQGHFRQRAACPGNYFSR
jgi:hypothetical protein